jgi:prepilin-type processing-associated H-X9-DG protein
LNPFVSWEATNVAGAGGYYTSYGINNWLYNPPPDATALWGYPVEDHWRTTHVKNAAEIPLFLDCFYLGGHPQPSNTPPEFNGATAQAGPQCMRRFCIDRHGGKTNMVFLDFAVRPVDLKELWVLRWHRTYDTAGPWTRGGGAQPSDWPDWMRQFKDY